MDLAGNPKKSFLLQPGLLRIRTSEKWLDTHYWKTLRNIVLIVE